MKKYLLICLCIPMVIHCFNNTFERFSHWGKSWVDQNTWLDWWQNISVEDRYAMQKLGLSKNTTKEQLQFYIENLQINMHQILKDLNLPENISWQEIEYVLKKKKNELGFVRLREITKTMENYRDFVLREGKPILGHTSSIMRGIYKANVHTGLLQLNQGYPVEALWTVGKGITAPAIKSIWETLLMIPKKEQDILQGINKRVSLNYNEQVVPVIIGPFVYKSKKETVRSILFLCGPSVSIDSVTWDYIQKQYDTFKKYLNDPTEQLFLVQKIAYLYQQYQVSFNSSMSLNDQQNMINNMSKKIIEYHSNSIQNALSKGVSNNTFVQWITSLGVNAIIEMIIKPIVVSGFYKILPDNAKQLIQYYIMLQQSTGVEQAYEFLASVHAVNGLPSEIVETISSYGKIYEEQVLLDQNRLRKELILSKTREDQFEIPQKKQELQNIKNVTQQELDELIAKIDNAYEKSKIPIHNAEVLFDLIDKQYTQIKLDQIRKYFVQHVQKNYEELDLVNEAYEVLSNYAKNKKIMQNSSLIQNARKSENNMSTVVEKNKQGKKLQDVVPFVKSPNEVNYISYEDAKKIFDYQQKVYTKQELASRVARLRSELRKKGLSALEHKKGLASINKAYNVLKHDVVN